MQAHLALFDLLLNAKSFVSSLLRTSMYQGQKIQRLLKVKDDPS